MEDALTLDGKVNRLMVQLTETFSTRIIAEYLISISLGLKESQLKKFIKKITKTYMLEFVLSDIEWFLMSRIIDKTIAHNLQKSV